MNKNKLPIQLVWIVDRSGSMQTIKKDAIGAFNSSLESQKEIPDTAEGTLVLFDDKFEMPVYRKNINEMVELDDNTFVPRGNTALADAIGRTVSEFKRMKSEGKVDKVIFSILTDGEENSSVNYTTPEIKKLIERCQGEDAWEFIFLSANQDAFSVGSSYGISAANTANFTASAIGTRAAFKGMNQKYAEYRSAVASGMDGDMLLNATRSSNLQDMVDEDE